MQRRTLHNDRFSDIVRKASRSGYLRDTMIEALTVPPPPKEVLEVAKRLHASLSGLIGALPGQPQRPMDLARRVGADKSVAHRLVTALTKGPNIGVLMALPGPVPLVSIVQAAKRLGVGEHLCAGALEAFGQFDGLIQSLAGD